MQLLGSEPVAFTTSYKHRSSVLANKVRITPAFDPKVPPTDRLREFIAIWDTGATNSVITSKVVDECGLKATGMANVRTAKGPHRTDTFLVGVFLPNRVAFPSVRVSRGDVHDADVLIGMDIIGSGDFAVTCEGGKTVFSYRCPSVQCIDFVKNPHYGKALAVSGKVSRNAKCPCGSGRKYKKCCGTK